MKTNAVREFLATVGHTPAKAAETQRALDAAYSIGIPVGEARELDFADMMPCERDAMFCDTVIEDVS